MVSIVFAWLWFWVLLVFFTVGLICDISFGIIVRWWLHVFVLFVWWLCLLTCLVVVYIWLVCIDVGVLLLLLFVCF